MDLRLFDFACCPEDQSFPLVLQKTVIKQRSMPASKTITCQEYCVQLEKQVNNIKTPCDSCLKEELVAGKLICKKCAAVYSINNSIADLLPKHIQSQQETEQGERDRQAEKVAGFLRRRQRKSKEVALCLQLLDARPNDIIADLGCGVGRMTRRLADEAGLVLALDFSLNSLTHNRKITGNAPSVIHIMANVTALPLRKSLCSKIVSGQVFEHLPSNDLLQNAIAESRRVIRDNGLFVISLYYYSWLFRLLNRRQGYHSNGIFFRRFGKLEIEHFFGKDFELDFLKKGLHLAVAKMGIKPHA